MKRIELLGPSGVGKTTLYNKICQTPVNNRPYLTLGEAYKLAAVQKKVPFYKLDLWIYQKLLQTGLFRSKEQGLGKTILQGLRNRQTPRDTYDAFSTSYNILLECYKNESHPYIAFNRISVYTKKMEEYLLFEHSLSETSCILFDEGLLHKHPGITEYGHRKFSVEDLKKDPALNPAGIISCELDADTIFQQALERKKQGTYTFTQGPMDREELKKHVENNVNFHKRKINFFKEISIPILEINPRDDLDINMKKINIFFSSILG